MSLVSPSENPRFALCQIWFKACHPRTPSTKTIREEDVSNATIPTVLPNLDSPLSRKGQTFDGTRRDRGHAYFPFIPNVSIHRRNTDNPKNVLLHRRLSDTKGRYWEKDWNRLPFDDSESRAEISAPQFGDNRIPPLHTILGVTVRRNT